MAEHRQDVLEKVVVIQPNINVPLLGGAKSILRGAASVGSFMK